MTTLYFFENILLILIDKFKMILLSLFIIAASSKSSHTRNSEERPTEKEIKTFKAEWRHSSGCAIFPGIIRTEV